MNFEFEITRHVHSSLISPKDTFVFYDNDLHFNTHGTIEKPKLNPKPRLRNWGQFWKLGFGACLSCFMCSIHGPYFHNHNFHNISLACAHNGFSDFGQVGNYLHLEYRNFMQPMERLSMHSKCFWFFFSIFPLFPTCSLQFPIGSQCVPNSTLLNPKCFAQSSTLESKESPI